MRYEDSGSICSYSEYIEELEDKITEKDKELELAKDIVRYLCRTGFDSYVADKIKALLGEE